MIDAAADLANKGPGKISIPVRVPLLGFVSCIAMPARNNTGGWRRILRISI